MYWGSVLHQDQQAFVFQGPGTIRIAGRKLYRVIITKPKSNGRHPAVLLISGLGCYSLVEQRTETAMAGFSMA